MKKNTLFAALILMVSLLTACACKHEMAPATCDTPATCTKCSETEGEPLGHKWADAACTTPKTCTVCPVTEGEALGHQWVEANYQDPQTCSVCGAVGEDALTAAFDHHGLKINAVSGKSYPYVTNCSKDRSVKTTGSAVFSEMEIFTGREGFEDKDGYEWRTVTATIVFSDDNARKYGWWMSSSLEDFYDTNGYDDSEVVLVEETGLYKSQHTVNFHGNDYPDCLGIAMYGVDESTIIITWYARVPVGYDGAVAGLRDHSHDWEDGMYIYDVADENTLFFRLA